MEKVKIVILGAGPSGLSAAHCLQSRGIEDFLVLEGNKEAGGLCRSADVDGSPLDIGGGHFLDDRKPEVLDLLFQFMPREEWNVFDRISTIHLAGQEIDYPLESNLWQLPEDLQVDFLESIAQAGCVTGAPMPGDFEDWIRWKLGDQIADSYMLPYNRKIWSIPVSELGTYWLYKLPSVSFRDTLSSCIRRKPAGEMPAHARFLYPKEHGYGEVWHRMGQALGNRLRLDASVLSIDAPNRIINNEIKAEMILWSIPWVAVPERIGFPNEVEDAISMLRHSSITVAYDPQPEDSPAHWIYEPDEAVAHHRTLCRHNFLPGSCGVWREINSLRFAGGAHWHHTNPYAYPLNTHGKPQAVATVDKWARGWNIIPLGRWGRWEHMNSDVAVSEAIRCINNLQL